ncbi:MAG: hypothetical protein A3D28_04910 [Omnitrophica bacterium RIFCSPHIGHO2_02_FULL_63_14]|nr:MAG: hypothetical protein A3D28_04910 [Omnitrophica bacterium RIFCSPHIGHO2_02_FULL_63_14]
MRSLRILAVGGLIGLLAAHPAAAQAPLQIGVAGAVRGSVELTTPGQVGRIIQSGEPLFLGQLVETDAQGHLQILLLDETVFTIGPNSALTIDEFVYDPHTQAGQVTASAVKGVFRFVTGKIARRNPSDMKVKLPNGLIGIRGTIVAGRIEGQRALVVLLGPGLKNNTGDRPGQISVANAVGTTVQEVTITRPGFGTEIAGPNVPPTPPAQVPAAELDALTQALNPQAPSQPAQPQADPAAGGPSATEKAGQATVVALESLTETQTTTELSESLGEESTQATQQAASKSAGVADGIATMDQLRTIETGQFHFAFGTTSSPRVFTQTILNGASVNIAGEIHSSVNLDFGARTIGGGNSHIRGITSGFGSGDIFFNETIEAQSFASLSGNATFTDSGNGVIATFTLNNLSGVVGQTATGDLTYDNGLSGSSHDAGSASAVTVTRSDNLSSSDADFP